MNSQQNHQRSHSMEPPSHKHLQVRTKPSLDVTFHSFMHCVFLSCTQINNRYKLKYKHTTPGVMQRYEIVASADWPPGSKNKGKKLKTNQKLIMYHVKSANFQESDQDMAESSSPTNNKRSQIVIHQSSQQKKLRNATSTEPDNSTHQAL